MKVGLLLTLLLFTVSCSLNSSAGHIPRESKSISLMQVVEAFDIADLPVTDAAVFDEVTDPNKLLGRPNQYVEKMNFKDLRGNKDQSCSIEVFRNETDAKARLDYVDNIGKSASMFATYNYLHKNVLVRINFGVLPKDADLYRQALESIN